MHNYVLVSVLIGTNQVGTVVWDLVIEIRVARLSFFTQFLVRGNAMLLSKAKGEWAAKAAMMKMTTMTTSHACALQV